ncbi:DUF4113 domain-containing protein [Candidatus Bandiella numerosa]|uniref:hypothetical protein n=1 Tax=Candidatus Bandiella numerosa TaxID=2570586 RepID=UPI00249F099D|nr:hypothetical protein [Candidatus Bandiella numerosa]WHA04497.1 DUF4113 domain-containing protein [Candidatus Bandiella numerosa]
MIKKALKSPNDIGNKKSTVSKNIVPKHSKIINKTKKSTSSNQKDLFNPELFLTIDKINKKFGKDTVCFGDQLGNLDYDKLLDSNDFNLLKCETDKLLKTYQQIDKQLIALSKANNTNANIYKRKQLQKQKDEIKQIYISIKKRITQIIKIN